MRFLHTSDWHIGRQFHNVSLLDDQRHVLEQIIEIVRSHAVDAVVIAGDVYDRSVPSSEAIRLLDEVVYRLNAACEVPLILIAGNHDGPERLAFGARQFAHAGVHISGLPSAEPQPVLLEDAHGPVAFYPLPYAEPATLRNLLGEELQGHEQTMRAMTDRVRAHNPVGRRSVVIAHCFLEGYAGSESERPLAVGGIETVPASCFEGFDYVALGHLHGAQARGATHVRYSGSILQYSFSEQQQKSVTLVDMDAGGACTVEHIALVPRRNVRVVEGELEAVLAAGKVDPHADDYVMVRLTDTHAILDRMNKLRTVYPNVLHLEHSTHGAGGEGRTPARDRMHLGEMPMFRDFFKQMTNEDLDDAAAAVVAGLLEQLHATVEN